MLLEKAPLILLTGASGWLGIRLAKAIIGGHAEMGSVDGGGHRLRCLVQAGEKTEKLLKLGAEIIRGDIRDPSACASLCKHANGAILIHAAGIIHPPRRTKLFEEVNVGGTNNLMAAARAAEISRIVAVSSNSPFGANQSPGDCFVEDSPYNPYMGYGQSKWRMENVLKSGMGVGHPEITIVRRGFRL